MSARKRARGDPRAKAELTKVKDQQRQLAADKERRLALLKAEPSLIVPGERRSSLTRSFCPPTIQRSGSVTMPRSRRSQCGWPRVHEEAAGATVHDVSRPELARRAGLTDWPGFDLRSLRPASAHGPAEDRAIEVKGRAGSGGVEVSENEWAKACNLRDRYWLYVVLRLRHADAPRLQFGVQVTRSGRLCARAKAGAHP